VLLVNTVSRSTFNNVASASDSGIQLFPVKHLLILVRAELRLSNNALPCHINNKPLSKHDKWASLECGGPDKDVNTSKYNIHV